MSSDCVFVLRTYPPRIFETKTYESVTQSFRELQYRDFHIYQLISKIEKFMNKSC